MSKRFYSTLSFIVKGSVMAILVGSTMAMAQDPRSSYYQDERYQDSRYQDNRYRDSQPRQYDVEVKRKSYYQYPQQQGRYYSQYYRPRNLPLPPSKTKTPVELLEESINKVLDFLSSPRPVSLQQITSFLEREITPHFDFQYMSRWVAGRYYRTMSKEQQRQFTQTFKELFITTFVQKISRYQNYPPVIDNFVSKRTKENEAQASARVLQEGGQSIQVDFKFIKTPNGWKVIDVRANGVSALFYYRNYFAERIRQRQQNQAVFK